MSFSSDLIKRLLIICCLLTGMLVAISALALSIGSSGADPMIWLRWITQPETLDPMILSIIWNIRLPRVLLAVQAGAILSVGGLVFQSILRNPLAEPYILGISGGSAVGAIIGILMGWPRFPGVALTAFIGSGVVLLLILLLSSEQTMLRKDALLLSGVMVNAFCSSVITFLLSISQDTKLHHILFWLMGDLSLSDMHQVGILFVIFIPCGGIIFRMAHVMNLLLMGKEMALSMGVHVKSAIVILLMTTSVMISALVSQSGLLGFVGLVIPHLMRLMMGSDHRILVPACAIGGGAYMVGCDLLARWLPDQGEMPVGVITALIGAPLFIVLLKKTHG